MGEHSGIEWTHHTFNPWWGCVRISPACEHCYAETFSKRLGNQLWGVQSDRRSFGDEHWNQPVKWNRKAAAKGDHHRVFCGSMCDVFEDRRDLDVHRERLWKLVEATSNLDWLLLTKRPENIVQMAPWREEWASNVWLGTTVEDQKRADQRLPHLIQHRSVVRFLSMEPLLGPVDLRPYLADIDWVILGGESGHGARPMQIDWARDVRDQCTAAGVPLFFKQWGNHAPDDSGERLVKLRRKDERRFDGRTWDEFPPRDLGRRASDTLRPEQEQTTM